MQQSSNQNIPLALNTATLGHNLEGYGAGWPIEKVIDACAERGLAGIVFWRREIGNRAFEIGERVRKAGMKVAGLCRTPYLVGSEVPSNWQDEIQASIDMASELGAPILTLVTGGPEPGTKGVLESQKLLIDRISFGLDYAKERNVKFALEPLNPMFGGNRTCIMTVRDAVTICNTINSTNLGVAVDVYHVWWDTGLNESLMEAGAERLLGLHLSDWLENTQDMLLDRGMMGDGVADIKSIRTAMKDAGYVGLSEVEIFSINNWWKQEPNVVLDTMVDRFHKHC